MIDSYIYGITALLPLVASMLVFQVNPYHALVIRGILGAVAALVYTVLGAADVALTEALVGTLLAIALYAVAVRSSLVLRLGVQKETIADSLDSHFKQITDDLRTIFSKHHLRVELVPYPDLEDLQRALVDKEVHAICTPTNPPTQEQPSYHTTTRLRRLYDIMHTELTSSPTHLMDVTTFDAKEKH
jgi:putative multicomponent Na+:H+ antiporter subunit B